MKMLIRTFAASAAAVVFATPAVAQTFTTDDAVARRIWQLGM